VAVTRLEIGADAGALREHIGAETFDRLPLPGTLRRDPADL
jgi:hypothetical protein